MPLHEKLNEDYSLKNNYDITAELIQKTIYKMIIISLYSSLVRGLHLANVYVLCTLKTNKFIITDIVKLTPMRLKTLLAHQQPNLKPTQ